MGIFKTIILIFICILILLPINLFGAVKPVFYSLSPYGAGSSYDLKNGSPTISITSGVATLSVAQTGNIGVGCDIDYGAGPTHVYIAPNRIPFNSGGTTKLKTGDKIEGGTSGATGIVRAIELTSGTWAGGDATGYIYFSTSSGTWQSEQINRTKPTSSSDIASCTGAIQGNIGNGNTQFVVKDPDGDDAANTGGSETINSIYHEYASQSAFEAGFTDVNHINNADLTAAEVVAHACCYYDHDNYDPDPTSTIYDWTGTTSANYYLQIYTPTGESEAINDQRHNGAWNDNRYKMVCTWINLRYQEDFGRIEGLQVHLNYTGTASVHGIVVSNQNAGAEVYILKNIVKATLTGGDYHIGIHFNDSDVTGYVDNNIIYDWDRSGPYNIGIFGQAKTAFYLNNNTVNNCYTGIAGGGIAKNNIVQNCTFTCFSNTTNGTHNITDEDEEDGAWGSTHASGTTTGDGSGSGKLYDSGGGLSGCQVNSIVAYGAGPSYTFVTGIVSDTELNVDTGIGNGVAYTVYTNMYGEVTFEGAEDYHLGAADTVAKDKGTDLSSDSYLPFWNDIDLEARDATWDVGADEYISGEPPPEGAYFPLIDGGPVGFSPTDGRLAR